jgi:hypothetical protein
LQKCAERNIIDCRCSTQDRSREITCKTTVSQMQTSDLQSNSQRGNCNCICWDLHSLIVYWLSDPEYCTSVRDSTSPLLSLLSIQLASMKPVCARRWEQNSIELRR